MHTSINWLRNTICDEIYIILPQGIEEIESFYHNVAKNYACVLWDADMRCHNGEWEFFKFNGKNKWNPVADTANGREEKKYMLNAYRVLLTRARQGIVICVPEGNNKKNPEGFPEDPTRLPEYYDGTYEYLKSLGIKEL